MAAAALTLPGDAYGHGILGGLEFPSQVAAVPLPLLAQLARRREVRAEPPVRMAAGTAEEPCIEFRGVALAGWRLLASPGARAPGEVAQAERL